MAESKKSDAEQGRVEREAPGTEQPKAPRTTVPASATDASGAEGDIPSPMEEHRARRARQRERRRESVRLADYSTIGLAFPIAIALGWFGGGWLGGLVGATDAGHWIGGAFGLLAGFYNVYKTALILQQQDEIPLEPRPDSKVDR